jgi:hypothetical protein
MLLSYSGNPKGQLFSSSHTATGAVSGAGGASTRGGASGGSPAALQGEPRQVFRGEKRPTYIDTGRLSKYQIHY